MGYIELFDDNFPGFLPLMAYAWGDWQQKLSSEERGQHLTQDLWCSIPFIECLGVPPESLQQDSTRFIQALCQPSLAANCHESYRRLKSNYLGLLHQSKEYIQQHISALLCEDEFFCCFQRYFHEIWDLLTITEKNKIYQQYVITYFQKQLHVCAQKIEQPVSGNDKNDLQLGIFNIQFLQVEFLDNAFKQLLQSPHFLYSLQDDLQEEFIQFCQFLAKSENKTLLYTETFIAAEINAILNTCSSELLLIEQLKNEMQIAKMKLSLLEKRASYPYRWKNERDNFEENKKQCDRVLQSHPTKILNLEKEINAAMVPFYYKVIHFSPTDKFRQAAVAWGITLDSWDDFGLADNNGAIPNMWSLLINGVEKIKSCSGFIKLAGTMGAVGWLGLGMFGGVVGLGVATGAAVVSQKIAAAGSQLSQMCNPHAVLAAWYGSFSARYKSTDFQVNENILALCGQDEHRAKILNNLYLENILTLDCLILDKNNKGLKSEPEAALKQRLLTHYRAIRAKEEDSETFWQVHLKEDIQAIIRYQYQTYLQAKISHLHLIQACFSLQKSHSQPRLTAASSQRLTQPPTMSLLPRQKEAAMVSADGPGIPIEKLELKETTRQKDYSHQALNYREQMIERLTLIGRLMAQPAAALAHFREFNTEQYYQLITHPLDLPYEVQVNYLQAENSFFLFFVWLKEKCFVPGAPLGVEDAKVMLAQPLEKLAGRTLWHLLTDLPYGVALLKEMAILPHKQFDTNQPWTTRWIHKLKQWQLGDFFSPMVQCEIGDPKRLENPLTYALSRGNILILRVFLENMIEQKHSFSQKALNDTVSLFFTYYPQAQWFCEAFQAAKLPPKLSLSSLWGKVSEYFLPAIFAKKRNALLKFELAAALMMRLVKGEDIPHQCQDIETFLAELSKDLSKYLSLKTFKTLEPSVLQVLARQISETMQRKLSQAVSIEQNAEVVPVSLAAALIPHEKKFIPYAQLRLTSRQLSQGVSVAAQTSPQHLKKAGNIMGIM